MATFTAIYDACVLYPATLRSLMMYLAMEDLFRARWSNDIHAEWMRNVVKDYPHITLAQVERIRDLMDRHVPDGVVTGYEPMIPALNLPDPADRLRPSRRNSRRRRRDRDYEPAPLPARRAGTVRN